MFSTIYPEALGETSASFAGLALSYAITVSEQLENQLKLDKSYTFSTNSSISLHKETKKPAEVIDQTQ